MIIYNADISMERLFVIDTSINCCVILIKQNYGAPILEELSGPAFQM